MGRKNDSGISDQKDRLSTEYSTMFQKEIISAVSVILSSTLWCLLVSPLPLYSGGSTLHASQEPVQLV